MSAEQSEVFAQFKKWIDGESVTVNPWHDDTFLLKFCRARKFDLDKIMLMFGEYMKYRKENNIDTIIAVGIYCNFLNKYRILTSNKSMSSCHIIQEDIWALTKLEDQFISKDQGSLSQKRFGRSLTKKLFGKVTTNRMRFFKSFISWLVVRSQENKSSILSRFWT